MFKPETRILIVDDFGSMRELMQRALKELGFITIIEAENGDVAYKALTQITPPIQIVISDWNMPKLDGVALLKKIRANPKIKDTPFILATTESEKDKILEAVQAGVSNYIVKPFNSDTLKQKLESVYQKLQK